MIPGLKSIDEEISADGKTRIVFNIEDDKVDDFFNYMLLEKNDTVGFEKLVTNALQEYLNRSQT